MRKVAFDSHADHFWLALEWKLIKKVNLQLPCDPIISLWLYTRKKKTVNKSKKICLFDPNVHGNIVHNK